MQTVIEKKVFLIQTLSADPSFILQYVQQEKIITTRDYNKLNQSNDTNEKTAISLLDMVIGKGEETCCKFVDLLRREEIQENFPELKQLFISVPTPNNQDNPVKAANELEDNLDELENVLSKYSKELAYTVQKIKKGARKSDHSSIPGSSSLSEGIVDTHAQRDPVSEMAPSNTFNEHDYYPVTQRPLGYCLIINNCKYEKLKNRKGTDVDKDELTEVFGRMHFIVEERRDLIRSDMENTLKEFSEKDHSKMDVFVCCILSHGEKGAVLGTDGKPVQIRDLTQPFALCKALLGKPKLFFIQACQGSKFQKGMSRQDGIEEDGHEEDAKEVSLSSVPLEADFLIGMATVETYVTFRHITKGSFYIQELCKQLKILCPRNEDILSILTKVNCNVSAKDLGLGLGSGSLKQMPEPRYTLTKKLVLPMD